MVADGETRPDSDLAVGHALGLEVERDGGGRLPEAGELALRQVPGVLAELGVVEVQEAQRVLALEHPPPLAEVGDQRRRRVEEAAEMAADTRPAPVDATVEAFSGEGLARAEPVPGLENDALVVPGRLEHGPQARLRQLELRELALEADRRQRPQHRQGAGEVGGGEEDEAGVAGRQRDSDLDLVALEDRDRAAGPLQRELQLEGRPEIGAAEVAEVDPLGCRLAGGDEGVPRVRSPHRTRAEALHGRPDVEPLQHRGSRVKAQVVLLAAGGAGAGEELLAADIGDADRAHRSHQLGIEVLAGPGDLDHPAVLIQVVAPLGDRARQLAEDLAGVDLEEAGPRVGGPSRG